MDLAEYLRELKRLKDTYSDDIPGGILHSTIYVDGESVTPRYKVRKGWFQGLIPMVDEGERLGYLDGLSLELWRDLVRHIDETGFRERLTTKDDIDKANALLDSIIRHLETSNQNATDADSLQRLASDHPE